MVKLTKKGTPYKNKAYIYGRRGELYVKKYIRCPRPGCNHRLIELKANTPAMDFKCSNTRENHWFQLKTYDYKRLRPNEKWHLECGEYSLQEKAFFDNEYRSDLIVIRYSPAKKGQVKSINWFHNQTIKPLNLSYIERKVKKYSRKNGVKKENGFSFRSKSILNILSSKSSSLVIQKTQLPDLTGEKSTPEKAPDWKQTIDNYVVCLNNQTCECCLECPAPCSHLEQAWRQFCGSCPNHRKVYGSNGAVYAVDLNTMTCTCPRFTYRKKDDTCKHIQEESKTINKVSTRDFSIKIPKQQSNRKNHLIRKTDDFIIDI